MVVRTSSWLVPYMLLSFIISVSLQKRNDQRSVGNSSQTLEPTVNKYGQLMDKKMWLNTRNARPRLVDAHNYHTCCIWRDYHLAMRGTMDARPSVNMKQGHLLNQFHQDIQKFQVAVYIVTCSRHLFNTKYRFPQNDEFL